jgi:hypothetical protein
MAKTMASPGTQQASWRGSLEATVGGHRQQMAGTEFADDMAGGLSTLILTWDQLATGQDRSSSAGPRLTRQLQLALKVPAVQRLGDGDKQAVYEWSIGASTLLLTLDQAVKQAGRQDTEHRIARRAGELVADLFGVQIEALTLTDAGLQVRLPNVVASSAPEGPPASAPAGGSPGIGNGQVSGVWIGIAQGEIQYDVVTGKLKPYTAATVLNFQTRFKVFFSDGTALNGLPPGGLDGVQSAPGGPGAAASPARYAVSGQEVSIWYDASGPPVKLTLVAADQLKHGNTIYYKCESFDGLRLDGTWGEFFNTPLPRNDRDFAKAIRFSPDGTFKDYGLFADSNHPNANSMDAPGHGTYQIRNFSLILSYSDGRVVKKSYSQPRAVTSTNRMIFLDMVQKSKL